MKVFLNGKYVPEDRAVLSVFDRGFLYGDALFEGVLVHRSELFLWERHIVRLRRGLECLKLDPPCPLEKLKAFATRLIALNRLSEGMLRLSITRGITGRTYSPANAVNPAVVMTLHPGSAPARLQRWPVITSTFRLLANDPLAGFKSANKLVQVLARGEADAAGAREAILLNTSGHLAEATTSNIFWIAGNTVFTPSLSCGALPGVTREAVIGICAGMNVKCREKKAPLSELRRADGAFLTMTSMGVVEIASLDGRRFKPSPLVRNIDQAYRKLLG